MANKFWVGGTGNWDITTTHWSTASAVPIASASCTGTALTTTGSPALVFGMTVFSSANVSLGTISGGSGNAWTVTIGGPYTSQAMTAALVGASVPTAIDNVYFDANSGGGTVTVNTATRLCLSLSFRGTSGTSDFTGSFASSGVGTNTISGGLTLSPSATYSGYTATMTFNGAPGTGNTFSITSNGKAVYGNLTFNNAAGNWTFTDSLVTQSTNIVTLTAGTLVNNNTPQYWGSFSSSGTGVRTLSVQYIELLGDGTVWNTSTATSLTFPMAVYTIALKNTSANTKTFTHSTTVSFPPLISIQGNGTGNYNITGNFSFTYIYISNTGGATTTITGTICNVATSNIDTGLPNACSGTLVLGSGTIANGGTLDFTGCSANFTFNTPTANTLSITNDASITLDPLLNLISVPTITFGTGGGAIYNVGKTWLSPITVNSLGAAVTLDDTTTTFKSNSLLTLTAGDLYATNLQFPTISVTGTAIRGITCGELILTATGSLITATTSTNLSASIAIIRIVDASATAKTFANSSAVALQSVSLSIEGSGSGAYTITGNYTSASIFLSNIGGAAVTITAPVYDLHTRNYVTNSPNACSGSLILSTAAVLNGGSLDFTGCSSAFAWNTPTANTLSVINGASITLDAVMTLTSIPTITFGAGGGNIYRNGRTWLSPITINSDSAVQFFELATTFVSSSTVTLTAGDLYVDALVGGTGSGNLEVTNLSVTGTATRSINCTEIILKGSGTLLTATTTTNLNFNPNVIRVAGTQTVARTLTLNTVAYVSFVYFEGTGTGGLTLAPGTAGVPIVYVTNTGGATFSISTGTITDIDFTGSTVNWNNAATQTVTIKGSITLGAAMTTTVTPNIALNNDGGFTQIVRCNGKSFVTGTITMSDPGFVPPIFVFADAFLSNAAVTITSTGGGSVNINANFTLTGSSTTLTLTSGNLNVNNGANISCAIFTSTNSNDRSLNMGSGVWTLTGIGTVWNLTTSTGMIFNAQQSRILINDTSVSAVGFAGGSLTYYTVEFARGASTAINTISGNNTFANFIDNTSTAAHTIAFTALTTNSFYRFNVRGSSLVTQITLTRTGSTNANLAKLGQGTVSNCANLIVSSNTQVSLDKVWYAGPGSTGAPNTSTTWLSGSAPSSQSLLGIGGVG